MNSSSPPRVTAIVALAALAVAWGAIPLFVRSDVPAVGLVGARLTFGSLALICVAAVLRRLEFPKIRRGRLALCGVLLALHWVSFFQALKLTTVAVALAVLYVGPIGAAILAGPILHEEVAPRLWRALAIAAGGTLLVAQPWMDAGGGDTIGVTWEGIAVAALSAAFLAAMILVGKPVAKDLGGLTMAVAELTLAAVLLLPATYQAVMTYPEHLLNFIVLGSIFTGLAGFVYWESMRHLPIATVGVIGYLEPASAVGWAAVFLGEVPNVTTWLGVGFVVAGGLVAATTPAREELAAAEPFEL